MYEFWGRHTLCTMNGIDNVDLNNSDQLIPLLTSAISEANATLVDMLCHRFSPEGLSIVAILQESHVALHIYPEHHALFMDAFTCGKTADPEMIVSIFVKSLAPRIFNFYTVIRS